MCATCCITVASEEDCHSAMAPANLGGGVDATSGPGDWGLGFGVWGLGFGVWGLGVSGLVFQGWGLVVGGWGWGLGFRVGGWGLGVEGWGLEFYVSRFELKGFASIMTLPPKHPRNRKP